MTSSLVPKQLRPAHISLSESSQAVRRNVLVFVAQPNRVNDGSMSIKLSNRATSDGSLSYHNKNIDLEPRARQLDYGFAYSNNIYKNTSFAVKHTITKNLNHKQDSTEVNSSFIGFKNNHSEIGLAINISKDSNSKELYYAMQF